MWKLCIYPWKQKIKVTRYERSINKAYCRHRYFPHSWLSISPLASTQFILCVLQLPLSNSLLYSLKTPVFTCSFALPPNPAYISFNHQPLFLLLQTLLLFLVSRIYKKTHTHTHTYHRIHQPCIWVYIQGVEARSGDMHTCAHSSISL